MDEIPDHFKVHDPNAPLPSKEPEPIVPERTPSIVLGEFFRGVLQHLGTPPKLEALVTEFETMTKPPELPEPVKKADEPEV